MYDRIKLSQILTQIISWSTSSSRCVDHLVCIMDIPSSRTLRAVACMDDHCLVVFFLYCPVIFK